MDLTIIDVSLCIYDVFDDFIVVFSFWQSFETLEGFPVLFAFQPYVKRNVKLSMRGVWINGGCLSFKCGHCVAVAAALNLQKA